MIEERIEEDAAGFAIWAVSSGSYSDYGIDAVFTTRELAQAYADREVEFGNADINGVEEWQVLAALPSRIAIFHAGAVLMPDGSLADQFLGARPTEEAYAGQPITAFYARYDDRRNGWNWKLGDEIPARGLQIQVHGRRSKDEATKALQDLAAEVRAHAAGIA